MKYIPLNDKQFTEAVKFYTSDDANRVAIDFFQFAIDSCLRYLSHGEVSHINNLIDASKRMRQVTTVRAMLKLVACHELTKAGGKYKSAKANTKLLKQRRKNVDKITKRLETIAKDASSIKAAKAAEKKVFDTTAQNKTIKSTAKKLVDVGLNDDTIIAMLRMQLEAIRADQVQTVTADEI